MKNMEPKTPEKKRELYRAGLYRMPAPPVCTVRWTDADWIKYIDNCGQWTTRKQEEEKP